MKVQPIALALLTVTVGCTHTGNRYSSSASNVSTLRAFAPNKVAVGPFTELPGVARLEVSCAGTTIETPEGTTFAEYIKGALISDLIMAGVYDPTSPHVLSGKLTALATDPSAFSRNSAWEMAIELSGNGKTTTSSERFEFRSLEMNRTACEVTSTRLSDAVQNLIGKAVQHPGFKELILPPNQ